MFAIIIIVIAVFVIILLFAIPYFAVTKKPEVQEYNSRERYKKRGKARR
jgi:hypothetical protein